MFVRFLSIFISSLLFVGFPVHAAKVKTTVYVGYETGFFSKSPNKDTVEKAKPILRQQVWKKYLTRIQPEQRALIEQKASEVEARLNEIIAEVTVIDTQVDEGARQMKFRVEAIVNDDMLNGILMAKSGDKAGQEEIYVSFLVLPRLQSEVKVFDAKVVKKASSTSKITTEQVAADDTKESDSGSAERSVEGEKVTISSKATTSGSTTRKPQKVKWRLGNARDVDTAVNRTLTTAGFEATTYGDAGPRCDGPKTKEARADLLASEAAELSDDVRGAIFNALRGRLKKEDDCKYDLFILGTLDIDSIMKDPNSDNIMTRANVSIKVFDLRGKRGPKTIASMGPVAYQDVGATEDDATTKALLKAAKEATQNLVQQLRAKGL